MPAIDPSLVGFALGPVTHTWTERDAMLYALGIGARLPDDLEFLYEAHGPRVEPTFALTAVTLMLPPLVDALAIDPRHLLHASQTLEVHRPPGAEGSCAVTRTVTGVHDRGEAAIVECEDRVVDADGPLATAASTWWVRGAGGFGGASPPRRRVTLPDAPPDLHRSLTTSTEQAALYRLSGDRNPVHIDPGLAREAGQPGAFLHGLCTFGFAAHALDRAAAPGRRLASLGGRFTRPVFPGETLELEAWWTTPGALARVSTAAGPVLDGVEAAFAQA